MAPDRTLLGMALMLAFCVLGPLLDVSAKLACETEAVIAVVLARMLVQTGLMAPVMAAMGLSWTLPRRLARLTAVRAGLLLLSTFAFVAGLKVMPIADALAIVFVMPFILMILGHLIFGDSVGPRRIAACAVGFGGALMVIRPAFAELGAAALWPLATAVLFAFYMLVTRALSRDVHPVAMQGQTALFGLAMVLPIVVVGDGSSLPDLDAHWPQGLAWLWLAGVGVWATASHICITYALKFAPSATLAPLQYLEIVVAAALGFLIWGDFPEPPKLAGIVVIVASGLYIIYRERLSARLRHPAEAP
jgi:drug/metabolite transporter (DMT)-like permease